MKKCIVTGGAGFIGSHLVDRLIKENHKVVVIDNLSTGSRKNVNSEAKFYNIDIQSPKIGGIFKKEQPDAIFHYAAQIDVRKSVQNPVQDAKVNILGSLNLLDNCVKYGVKKVVFASTGGAIYGDVNIIPTPESCPANPVSPYGVAKLSVEHYLHYYHKIYGISFVALRFSNVYGPRQNSKGEAGVVAIFSDSMLSKRRPIIYGNGKQKRDYVFVQDVIQASVLALKKNRVGIFNIGTGKETSVKELFLKIKHLTGFHGNAISDKTRVGDIERNSLDNTKAKKILQWSPSYGIERGLKETVDYFKDKR